MLVITKVTRCWCELAWQETLLVYQPAARRERRKRTRSESSSQDPSFALSEEESMC